VGKSGPGTAISAQCMFRRAHHSASEWRLIDRDIRSAVRAGALSARRNERRN
jgi:hypothetical protein